MTQNAGFLGRLRMIKPVHIGVICLAFFVSVVSNSSFADNAVTGSGTECVYSTLNTYTGPSTIKANWDPNTINLYWYNDEQKLTVQTAANTCNYDSGIALPSTNPTKTGYTFSGWEVYGAAPAGYTLLEYLEGGKNSNSYINLGFPATTTMQTVLIASVETEYSADQILLGSSDKTAFANGVPYAIDRYPTSVIIPNGGTYSYNTVNVVFTTALSTVYHFKVNYPTVGQIGINSTMKTGVTNLTSVSSKNLYLFGFNGNNAYSTQYSIGKMRAYRLTMWDNGTLIHNFIPVKRNNDSVLGMYDTVTGTFLTNAGSGSFTAGTAIQ